MSELVPLLFSATILGLLGGGHCLGMCGGLMGALTLAIPPEQRGRRLRLLLAYNLGRILSYAAAGLLIGLGGWALANSPAALALRLIAALLLIVMGFYLAGWWSGLTRIEALGQRFWRHLQPVASRLLPVDSLPRALLLGAVWGWLPCGLVYSTLLWAASQGNALDSTLLMLAFGLGTWPMLLATGLAAERLTAWLRQKHVRIASGLLVILFGFWTLPGPHQTWLTGHQGHAAHRASATTNTACRPGGGDYQSRLIQIKMLSESVLLDFPHSLPIPESPLCPLRSNGIPT
ncbi:hypothetical protein AvCA_19930 [Azotobacter vinelandii CA]|uniref:Urease accessory protein UreH-like transmembrane domain-containing protein n=2 Tax=Azotobacter vinelandii TaxID=354 RepID=C1DEL5_AZOVD|nr:conserved hypothetical protein [Azotobacter vinelandii DJ]AGK16820.1 hypothetical protein AvCA_19930 [Azotobacter vinelandii CA]AGK20324.1 hypothetical protein AvCA6_19930 [Azotobacter vinelandii CA6]GLK59911.1 hypothetical protein GCM10017624_20690 [Azotobacter vinelandii]SFX56099.1 hypothetical protein SAMN04244547_01979 [Azotobacter vinelandii]